jgi:hypothetical protein
MIGGHTFSYVLDLVTRRKYEEAKDVLHGELEKDPRNLALKQHLADVLALDGEADGPATCSEIADEWARRGQPAKAITVLKKMQRLAGQGRRGPPLAAREGASGLSSSLVSLYSQLSHAGRERVHGARRRDGRAQDLRGAARPAEAPQISVEQTFGIPRSGTVMAVDGGGRLGADDERTFVFKLPAGLASRGGILEPEDDASGDAIPASNAPAPAPSRPGAEAPAPLPAPKQKARSPLFSDFSEDELLAVISGLNLASFEPGDVIMSEGEPGGSLFVLTEGTVKAFVKDQHGKNHRIRVMGEGTFFGEVSILTGSPRSATIVAATRCELLELDRAALDDISARQPRVHLVLKAFCGTRLNSAAEALVRRQRQKTMH